MIVGVEQHHRHDHLAPSIVDDLRRIGLDPDSGRQRRVEDDLPLDGAERRQRRNDVGSRPIRDHLHVVGRPDRTAMDHGSGRRDASESRVEANRHVVCRGERLAVAADQRHTHVRRPCAAGWIDLLRNDVQIEFEGRRRSLAASALRSGPIRFDDKEQKRRRQLGRVRLHLYQADRVECHLDLAGRLAFGNRQRRALARRRPGQGDRYVFERGGVLVAQVFERRADRHR